MASKTSVNSQLGKRPTEAIISSRTDSAVIEAEDALTTSTFKTEVLSVTNRMYLKKLSVFTSVKVAQLLCASYILILTFSKSPLGLVDPETGKIIDVDSKENTENGVIFVNGNYRPIVAETNFEMLCLAISRISAFSLYPVMIAVFISKSKATLNFLSRTPISMYMIHDYHELHSYAGKYIVFDAWIHTFFHLDRWASQGNISLLWSSRAGLSGLIVLAATLLITLPMMFFRNRISYEVRKALHYLFYVFAVGICFHVPVSAIPNGGFIAPVLGFCICLYTLDAVYVTLFMTEKIETTIFEVLPSGVKMSMDVSEAFQKRMGMGGFAYVCLPWVDRNQWHAFSLFENPDVANRREVFMLNSGDWTRAVHQALQRNTVRPVWVQGPFESPFNNAVMYDNQIICATGIGITPALSVICAHKDSRRINLVWAVRDADMLEFFLEHLYLDHSGWNLIFYTGNTPLDPALEEINTNVRVIKHRPDLEVIIPNIIYGIESGNGPPEKYTPSGMARVKHVLTKRMHELDDTTNASTSDKVKDLTQLARRSGFHFTELVDELDLEIQGGGHAQKENEVNTNGNCPPKTDDPGSEKALSESSSTRASVDIDVTLQCTATFDDSSYPLTDGTSSTITCHDVLSTLSSDFDYTPMQQGRRDSLMCLTEKNSKYLITSTFKPWKEQHSAKDYVKSLDKEKVLSTWGILYCGGNSCVETALKRISEEYHIALNAESFDW